MRSEFNTYHWHEFRVTERSKIPSGPHFQVLVFGQRTEYVPAYDIHDSPSSTSVPIVDVYVFKDRKQLEMMVDEAARTGASFVFYYVNSLGRATVKVDVDTEVDGPTGVDGEGNPMQAFGHGRGD